MRIVRAAADAIGNARAEPPLDVGGRGPGRPLFLAADLGDAVPGPAPLRRRSRRSGSPCSPAARNRGSARRNRSRSSPALPCGDRSRCGAGRPRNRRLRVGRVGEQLRSRGVEVGVGRRLQRRRARSRRAIAPIKSNAIPRPAMSLPLTSRRIPRRFNSLDRSISERKRNTSSPNAAPAQLPWKLLQECRSSGRDLWKYCDSAPAPGRHRPGGVLAVAGVNAALTAFVYQMLKHDRAGNRSAPNATI